MGHMPIIVSGVGSGARIAAVQPSQPWWGPVWWHQRLMLHMGHMPNVVSVVGAATNVAAVARALPWWDPLRWHQRLTMHKGPMATFASGIGAAAVAATLLNFALVTTAVSRSGCHSGCRLTAEQSLWHGAGRCDRTMPERRAPLTIVRSTVHRQSHHITDTPLTKLDEALTKALTHP